MNRHAAAAVRRTVALCENAKQCARARSMWWRQQLRRRLSTTVKAVKSGSVGAAVAAAADVCCSWWCNCNCCNCKNLHRLLFLDLSAWLLTADCLTDFYVNKVKKMYNKMFPAWCCVGVGEGNGYDYFLIPTYARCQPHGSLFVIYAKECWLIIWHGLQAYRIIIHINNVTCA